MRHSSAIVFVAAVAFPAIALGQTKSAKPASSGPTAAQEKKVRAVLDASRADFDPCVAAAKEEAALKPEVDRLRAEVEKNRAEPKESADTKKNFETASQFTAVVTKQTDAFLRMTKCEAQYLAAAKTKLKATGVSEKGITEIFGKWKAEQNKPE